MLAMTCLSTFLLNGCCMLVRSELDRSRNSAQDRLAPTRVTGPTIHLLGCQGRVYFSNTSFSICFALVQLGRGSRPRIRKKVEIWA